jgi:hypothetical protein
MEVDVTGCRGPQTVVSSGSYVVSETPIYDISTNEYIGEVLLTWSPTCETAWAGTYVGGDLVRPFFVQATATSTSPPKSYTRTNNYVYVAISPMVYATDASYVRVCGRIEDPGVSGSACSP